MDYLIIYCLFTYVFTLGLVYGESDEVSETFNSDNMQEKIVLAGLILFAPITLPIVIINNL